MNIGISVASFSKYGAAVAQSVVVGTSRHVVSTGSWTDEQGTKPKNCSGCLICGDLCVLNLPNTCIYSKTILQLTLAWA